MLPIGVFLLLYLGLGLIFEYRLEIPMGFYNIPIVIPFLVAILVACLQNRKLSFDDKLTVMGQGVGDKNIITMLLIFLAAGAFVGVVGRSSAQSVAYFMLSLIPARFAVAVLFVVACFVSTAMGTSVGTITLITPIAVEVAAASGFGVPLCVGSVVGGAMFGDNLSFISDTTIAACNGQGCAMKDKFRENFAIALPAALATLAVILVLSFNVELAGAVVTDLNEPITRLEYGRVAALALGFTESDTKTPFADTEDGLILALYDAGIMEGSVDDNGDRMYMPDANIRRSEISTVIWRINNYRAQ